MSILKNATIYTMLDEKPFVGDIIIGNGKIVGIANNITPAAHDNVVDLAGLHLMPGIIDAHTHIGMWEDGLDFEGADGNESTDPITPQLRAIDAVNPLDHCFEEARNAGVTTVATGPGSANVLGGSFLVMKTFGNCVDDMVIKNPLAIKAAFGENPKRVYSEQKRGPVTRMASIAMLREALEKARRYAQKLELAQDDPSLLPEFDPKLEALLPLLRKEIPMKAHAHRADDIQSVIRIAKEFDLDYTIEHCTEGYLISDQLLLEQSKIIIGPLVCDRGKPELRNLNLSAPRILDEAGIKFAVMSDHPVMATKHLITTVALAVREGLDPLTALRSITLHAAEILGLEKKIGSLAEGKDADLVAFSHFPLDVRAKAKAVWIDGKMILNDLD